MHLRPHSARSYIFEAAQPHPSGRDGGFAGAGPSAPLQGDPTSSLIAAIYDAALDAARWPAALGAAADYIGGAGASLWIRNPQISPSEQFHAGGEESAALALRQHQGGGGPQPDAAEPPSSPQTFLDARFASQSGPGAGGSEDCIARLTVFRGAGGWDEEARRRLGIVVPHVQRAVEMARIISSKRAAAATMADMLDGLNASIFLVDENGETVHVNANGEAKLAEGHLLRTVRGKLTANAPEAISALGRAQALKYHRPLRFSVTERTARRDARTAGCHVAHMFPVEAHAARTRDCHRPVVAGLVLDEAILHADDPVDKIARHYGLARSERDVLLAIVEGCGLTEAADRMSISHSTLKTYLRRLFEKTGTSRQMELVKLCAAFRSPFAGSRA